MQIYNYPFLLSSLPTNFIAQPFNYFFTLLYSMAKIESYFSQTLNLNRLILLRQDFNPKTTPGAELQLFR